MKTPDQIKAYSEGAADMLAAVRKALSPEWELKGERLLRLLQQAYGKQIEMENRRWV